MISRFSKAFLLIIFALFLIGSIALLHPPSRSYMDPWTGDFFGEGGVEKDLHVNQKPPSPPAKQDQGVHGGVIMAKLGNATAKAELGRATWKLLFWQSPTQDERDALNNYFHIFSRVYPCGECAAEFQKLLKKYPPQTSSRKAAALWLCYVHNQVNARLLKPEFDCANLDSTYDCGCGDSPVNSTPKSKQNSDPMDLELDPTRDRDTGVGMIRGGR